MNNKLIGSLFIAAGIGIILFVAFYNSSQRQQPIVFSQNALLTATWNNYKLNYIEPETYRTLDKQREFITTSEGQSYTMLRAAWMDDQDTFDKSWKWTKDNLGRQHDKLFSWLFGQRPDGTYGVLIEQGGNNSATDGDTDIAMALLFAYSRWQKEEYLNEAKAIIQEIWNKDLAIIKDEPYITVSETERNSQSNLVITNPSYFAPYAYRMFAAVDPEHDWNKVIDTSYRVLEASIQSKLDKNSSAGLPPDWIAIDRATGEILPATGNNLTSNYGYDGMRTPWRVALDWHWYKEDRARHVLGLMKFLDTKWDSKKKLASIYAHDGTVIGDFESPAMYGGALGYFLVHDRQSGQEIYDTKLKSLYDVNNQRWRQDLGYYEENWAWFGIALWDNNLPNLFQQ